MPSVNQFKALFVRLVLLLHFALVVWRVTTSWGNQYWLLSVACVPLVLEGAYSMVRRDGVEWKLFSLCFFFYLAATLPGIWMLEIKKTQTYQNANKTQITDLQVTLFDTQLDIPVRLSPDTWVLVVEEMMLYLMILGRWFLPRGDVGREQLTQLLFGFVGIASDIMELFGIFDDDSSIRHNDAMTYTILSVWSLSVLQFTLTFATAHRPRRARGLRTSSADESLEQKNHKRSVLRVELLATFLSLFMQDGPFLAVRLYTMITYNIITYSLVFFTAKNTLVILLLVYKVFLLLSKICCPKQYDHDDDDDDDDDKGGEGDGDERYKFRPGKRHGVMELDVKRMSKKEKEAYALAKADILKIQEMQMMDNRIKHVVDTGNVRNRGGGGAAQEVHAWSGLMPEGPGPLEQAKLSEEGTGRPKATERPEGDQPSGHTPNVKKGESLDRGDRQQSPTLDDKELEVIGELQKVIDGPGTPAKPMNRSKKYDKLMVANDDETGKSESGGRGDEIPMTTIPDASEPSTVGTDDVSLGDSLKRRSHGSSSNSGEVSDDSGIPSMHTTVDHRL